MVVGGRLAGYESRAGRTDGAGIVGREDTDWIGSCR